MAIIELILPSLGEGIMEATILKWHKNVGDHIQEEDTAVDIATDKVDSEVPSTASGIIKEILFKENDVVPVGAVIAKIETENAGQQTAPTVSQEESNVTMEIPYLPSENVVEIPTTDQPNNGFYSPLVVTIAQKEGIPLTELANIPGTAQDGRLSKQDVLAYLAKRGQKQTPAPVVVPAPAQPTAAPTPKVVAPATPTMELKKTEPETADIAEEVAPELFSGNVEIIEMDRMRKLIAKHMKESQQISATVTSFEEVDVTNIVQWRNKVKNQFEKQENTKLTFTPLFMECVIRALKKYPMLNSSIIGDKIILKKDINLGMATALPNGNLIVPTIKNASDLNLAGLSRAVNNLANNARSGKLKPSDTQDGTFTVTNVGSFGSLTGTPIINQPQVAILAIGTIKKRPVVIETPTGDTIGIRHMMILSLSYDHRIIDGALGSTFLHEIVKEMENWDQATTI